MVRSVLFAVVLVIIACRAEPINTFSFVALGGELAVTYTGPRQEEVERAVIKTVQDFSSALNYYDPNSLVSRLNRDAHREAIAVPPWFCRLVEDAVRITRDTEGKFDVTYKSEGFLWDIHRGEVPTAEEVTRHLPLIGVSHLLVDCSANTIRFTREGVRLDFGGIAAGYAADRTRRLFEQAGIRNFLVNYTGEIVACGSKNGASWRIGIRDPFDRDHLIKTLDVPREGCLNISTSGDYERYLEKGNKRYSHIIDPSTGMPVEGSHSVTVVAADCLTADALATALSVGWRDREYLQRMKRRWGLQIYLVTGSQRTLETL